MRIDALRLALLHLLLCAGCDARPFFGEAFLGENARHCGVNPAVCQEGTICDVQRGVCRTLAPPDAAPSCENNRGCADPTPICDTGTRKCRGCAAHAECQDSGLCRLDETIPAQVPVGACLPRSLVCVVDGDACSARDGGAGEPLCELSEAVGRCPYVILRPRQGEKRYALLSLSEGSLTVFGAPGGSRPSILGVEVRGARTQLSMEEVKLSRLGASAASCADGASLSLRGATIVDSGIGVYAAGCGQITVERARISGNRNDGLHLDLHTRSYRLVNTLITDNGLDPSATASGVYIASPGPGVFAYSTVVRNGRFGQDGGAVGCDADVTLRDSIIVGNGSGVRRTQFGGACRLERVVVGEDGIDDPGAIKLDARLDAGFALTEASVSCIDRAREDPSVRVDLIGTSRPQRGGYDIGCFELRGLP